MGGKKKLVTGKEILKRRCLVSTGSTALFLLKSETLRMLSNYLPHLMLIHLIKNINLRLGMGRGVCTA